MTIRRYATYKPSGVAWLGAVPGHWDVQPIKRHTRQLTEKTNRRDHPVALENIQSWTGRYVQTDTEFEGVGVAFRAGDILFGKLRPYLAKVLVAKQPGEAVGDFIVMRPLTGVFPQFASYQLLTREFIAIVDGSTFGSKMPRASWDFVSSLQVVLPPHEEQIAITSFLDHETAKIDALVEEQKRLIELLKEKRQAVISQAVTKGLDLTVAMKDSGVAWLGRVPAHWRVCAVRRVAARIEQGWSPECEAFPADENSWGVLKAGCVNRGVFDPSENKTLPPGLAAVAEFEVKSGDVLISRASGSPELVGSTALVVETRRKLMLSDKIFRAHLTGEIAAAFFVWAMNGRALRYQIEQALSGEMAWPTICLRVPCWHSSSRPRPWPSSR